jgi:hypothetical protein
MKIIVILARKGLGRYVESVELTRKLYRFGFRSWPRDTLFQQHLEILSATRDPVHQRT